MCIENDSAVVWKQRLFLLCFCIVALVDGTTYSVQGPFFPAEAEKKGATATEVGLVFSCYELAMAFGSGVLGPYVASCDGKNSFLLSISISGICTGLFGFLTEINDRTIFIGSAMILRILTAIGSGLVFVSLSMLLNVIYLGQSTARNMIIGQTMFAFGITIGPSIGSILYWVGGFTAPFFILGCIQLIIGTIVRGFASSLLEFQKNGNGKEEKDISPSKFSGTLKLLRIPAVFVNRICVLSATITICFLMPLLEPNLRQFHLSTFQVGLVFGYTGLLYVISALCLSFISEKVESTEECILLGIVLLLPHSLLIGPDPHIPVEPSLYLVIISMSCQSLGISLIFAFSNQLAFKEAIRNGFSNDETTSALLSGQFLATMGVGGFLGPTISGILFDHYGFRKTTEFTTGLNLICGFIFALFLCIRQKVEKGEGEETESEDSNLVTSPVSLYKSFDKLPVTDDSFNWTIE